jgi:hypothetical protein
MCVPSADGCQWTHIEFLRVNKKKTAQQNCTLLVIYVATFTNSIATTVGKCGDISNQHTLPLVLTDGKDFAGLRLMAGCIVSLVSRIMPIVSLRVSDVLAAIVPSREGVWQFPSLVIAKLTEPFCTNTRWLLVTLYNTSGERR